MARVFVALLLLSAAVYGATGDCVDTRYNCDQYATEDCKTYKNWAKLNCAKTCGLCTVEPTKPEVPPTRKPVVGDCEDTRYNCDQYTTEDCKTFKNWAKLNCAKTCGLCTAEPTKPEVPPTRKPVVGDCVDTRYNCDQYATEDCKTFKNWAKLNCAKTCGLCTAEPTKPEVPPTRKPVVGDCVDNRSDCDQYATEDCKTFKNWAKLNCAKTCGLCTAEPTKPEVPPTRKPVVGDCVDNRSDCDQYATEDCKTFKNWAKLNCAKTCGLCTVEPTKPEVPPTRKPVVGDCEDTRYNCDQYTTEDCKTYKNWAKLNCAKTCGLCTAEPTKPEVPPTRKPVVGTTWCEEGWKPYTRDKTCLYLVGIRKARNKIPWHQARSQCQYFGGNLVIIRDATKNEFVKNMFPKDWEIWIGVKNVATDANDFKFKYVDGAWIGNYQPWESYSPDNYNNKERCVTLNRYDEDGKWNDVDCKEDRPYMCEKPQ